MVLNIFDQIVVSIVTWTVFSVYPPPHMTRRFGDPPFSRPSLLWDTAQYIGHRILGRDRPNLLLYAEPVSAISIYLVSGCFSIRIIIFQGYLLGR